MTEKAGRENKACLRRKMNKTCTKLPNRCLTLSLVAFLPLSLYGCSDSPNVNSQRDLVAPGTILVGQPLSWSVATDPGEQLSATVFDADNNVVYHSGFEEVPDFAWTPIQPGMHLIDVQIRPENGGLEFASGLVDVMPRGTPLVTGTAHPLVALYTYTIPAGLEGQVVYTCTTCPAIVTARTFTTLPVEGTGSEVGVLLPALRPNSAYTVQHEIFDGVNLIDSGPILNHTTGPIPILLQEIAVLVPTLNPELNALLTVTPVVSFNAAPAIPQMIDATGSTVWYHTDPGNLSRPTGNGWAWLPGGTEAFELIDYTGQVLRRITSNAIAGQLEDLGYSSVGVIHHEIRPLPNDRYAAFMTIEKLVTGLQGPGTVDVLGDMVVVLDDRMRVVWAWDALGHLDLARPAILGDLLEDGQIGIPLELAPVANDWTHSNSIDYDANDGNLVLSVRHQSWVVKIAYENGEGDGHILWRLGRDGDFTLTDNDTNLWFSYQHDANILPDGRLALYDNGNERLATDPNATSRGQVYILDEEAMTAQLDINIDLEVRSGFLGSAALTPDGSMHFNSGAVGIHEDIARDGSSHGAFQTDAWVYRSFRMMDPFDLSPN